MAIKDEVAQDNAVFDAQQNIQNAMNLLLQQHDSVTEQILQVHPIIRPQVPLAQQVASLPQLAHHFAVYWHLRTAPALAPVSVPLTDALTARSLLHAAAAEPGMRALSLVKPAAAICPPASLVRASADSIALRLGLPGLQSLALRKVHASAQAALLTSAAACSGLTRLDLTDTGLQRSGRESLAAALLSLRQLQELVAPACDAVQLAAAVQRHWGSIGAAQAERCAHPALHTVSLAMVVPGSLDAAAVAEGWQAFGSVHAVTITLCTRKRRVGAFDGEAMLAEGAMLLVTRLPALAALALHGVDASNATWLDNLIAPLMMARGLTHLALHSSDFLDDEVEQFLFQLPCYTQLQCLALVCTQTWHWPRSCGSLQTLRNLHTFHIAEFVVDSERWAELLQHLAQLRQLRRLCLQPAHSDLVVLTPAMIEQLSESIGHVPRLELLCCTVDVTAFASSGDNAVSDGSEGDLPQAGEANAAQNEGSEYGSAHGSDSILTLGDFASAVSDSNSNASSLSSLSTGLVSQCPAACSSACTSHAPSAVSLPMDALPPLQLHALTACVICPAVANAALFGFVGWLSDCTTLRTLGLTLPCRSYSCNAAELVSQGGSEVVSQLGAALAALPQLTRLALHVRWPRAHMACWAQQLAQLGGLRSLALVFDGTPCQFPPQRQGSGRSSRGRGRGCGDGGRHGNAYDHNYDHDGYEGRGRARGRGRGRGRHSGSYGGMRQVQHNCIAPHACVAQALVSLRRLTGLTQLEIACRICPDRDIASAAAAEVALWRMLRPLTQLHALAVGCCCLTGAPASCAGIAQLSRLTSLEANLASKDASQPELVTSIRQLPCLQRLQLGLVQSRAQQAVVEAYLQGATALTQLCITKNDLYKERQYDAHGVERFLDVDWEHLRAQGRVALDL